MVFKGKGFQGFKVSRDTRDTREGSNREPKLEMGGRGREGRGITDVHA